MFILCTPVPLNSDSLNTSECTNSNPHTHELDFYFFRQSIITKFKKACVSKACSWDSDAKVITFIEIWAMMW